MHYTDYVENIKLLIKNGEIDKAEKVLLQCCDLTEAESRQEKRGVAPWYYEKLAIIYYKQKRFHDEIAILEQYDKQNKGHGVKPKTLKERLLKAKKRYSE